MLSADDSFYWYFKGVDWLVKGELSGDSIIKGRFFSIRNHWTCVRYYSSIYICLNIDNNMTTGNESSIQTHKK